MSEAMTHYSSYDPLARIYNEDWAMAILKETLSPLDRKIAAPPSTGGSTYS
jgi:hypothetical protein